MGTRTLWAAPVVVLGLLLLTSLAAYSGRTHAQQHAPTPPGTPPTGTAQTGQAIAVNPNDVRSMDAIVAALYDVISGPAGQKRDWNRLRALCVSDARLVAVGHRGNGDIVSHSFSIDEYVSRATPVMEKQGFFEREIGRHVDTFDHISQVFSAYESRHTPTEKPFDRGINSIQLLNDGHRWWVVTIFWEPETPGHKIPRKYLRMP